MKRTSGQITSAVGILLAAFVAVSCGGGHPKLEKANSQSEVTCFAMSDPSDTFPRSALKNAPGAEVESDPASEALDQWLSSESAKGAHMHQPGWIVLQRSDSLVKFGLPQAGFGIVAQVNVGEQGGKWKMVKAQPCTLTKSTPGRLVMPVYEPSAGFGEPTASQIFVETRNDLSACGGAEPSITVSETSSTVAIFVTYPWDAESQTTGRSDGDCAGTGEVNTHRVKLSSALGNRRVVQSGFVPARRVIGIDAPEPTPLG